MYRSAGWPCQDVLEVELLAAGLLERRTTPDGCETLRVTDAGIAALSAATAGHRAALSAHETLLRRVALDQQRAGRIAWRGLALRVPLPVAEDSEPNQPPTPANRAQAAIKWEANVEDADIAATPAVRWHMACPDLFSVSLTSVEAYLDPVVHEIKVSRADLLADLKRPHKRAAYLAMGGACWYVLGLDARGRAIGSADDVPPECGVMVATGDRCLVLRAAPRRPVERLPFATWMALARATPLAGRDDDDAQSVLRESD
ncbi:hypothetical protein [uncultured Luteimonas sp.]|nr:hypothetical protein [uncultured Luteimonas sp.]